MEPIALTITDVLDLHTFQPKEIPSLLEDYLSACIEAEIFSVRIIHGKGTGVLRDRVLRILKKSPLVASFGAAPAEAGGWGATLVELKRDKP
jgi:DNA-nicking Smr family endonuclease